MVKAPAGSGRGEPTDMKQAFGKANMGPARVRLSSALQMGLQFLNWAGPCFSLSVSLLQKRGPETVGYGIRDLPLLVVS
jgi:hypothetical protein